MTTKRARTATAMSCFVAGLVISACMHIESTGPDGSGGSGGGHVLPDAYVPTTSLDGSIACGSFSCPSQTVCTMRFAGLDAGIASDAGTPYDPSYSCTTVPTSCRIYDCTGSSCSQCIADLCYYGASSVMVTGRYLTCPGV